MRNLFYRMFDESSSEPVFKFIPQIKVSPNSTLLLQVEPKDPNTASNILINAFVSRQNHTLVPVKIEWSRYKFKSSDQYTVDKITGVTGNTYMCEPADLGSIIQAKVKSLDPMNPGQGQVTIGPIRIEPMQKRLIDGALYDQTLLSQIIVLQGDQKANVNLKLGPKSMSFVDQSAQCKLSMPFTLSQPRIQLNQKDPTKIYLRFEQDSDNKVRQWLNKVFRFQDPSEIMNQTSLSAKIPHSNTSSTGSKNRLFQKSHVHCINKLEVRFLSRNARDLFLFTIKAFICKEDMKNSVILQKIQSLQALKSQQDCGKFFQYLSLKSQIIRLAQICKDLQTDRNNKINDISNMQESISEMTLTYLKIIEEKSKHEQVDLQQSYSMISMKREEILGRKNLRELKSENQKLRGNIRQLNEQLQLQKFFREKDNESMIFNQTTNPFAKKNFSQIMDQSMQEGSYYVPVTTPTVNILQSGQGHRNMLQFSRQYIKVLQQNKKLKSSLTTSKLKVPGNNKQQNLDESKNIQNLLQSLHQNEDKQEKISQLQALVQQLKRQSEQQLKQNKQISKEKQILARDVEHISKKAKQLQAQNKQLKTDLKMAMATISEGKNNTSLMSSASKDGKLLTFEKAATSNRSMVPQSSNLLPNSRQQNEQINTPQLQRIVAFQPSNQNNISNMSFRTGRSSNTSMMSESMSMSMANMSMTSEAQLMVLEKKLIDLSKLNAKFESENSRLRKQRDYYRAFYQKNQATGSGTGGASQSQQQQIHSYSSFKTPTGAQMPAERDNAFADMSTIKKSPKELNDESNIMGDNDNSFVCRLKQENQKLQNQKNRLMKKIESLSKEASSSNNAAKDELAVLEKKSADLVRQNGKLFEENQKLEQTLESMKESFEKEKKELMKKVSSNTASGGKNFEAQISKLKKVNSGLLQQIKELRRQRQQQNNVDFESSRVIELESQLNHLKKHNSEYVLGVGETSSNQLSPVNNSSQQRSQQLQAQKQALIKQVGQLTKENQRLKQDNDHLKLKISHQTGTIEKLMTELEQLHQQSMRDSSLLSQNNSFIKKYVDGPVASNHGNKVTIGGSGSVLNQPATNGNSTDQIDKYKKRCTQMEKQLELLRRNADAMNRSRDLSMSMIGFEEEKLQLLKKQNQSLIMQNEILSNNCHKFSKDARQANIQLKQLRQKMIVLNREKLQVSGS